MNEKRFLTEERCLGLLQDYAPLSRPGSAAEAALVAAVAHMSGSEAEDEGEDDEGGSSELEISAMEGEGLYPPPLLAYMCAPCPASVPCAAVSTSTLL